MKSGSKRPVLPPAKDPTPSPTPTSVDVVNARNDEMALAKRRRGRTSTMLTSGDLGMADIEKKKLLG